MFIGSLGKYAANRRATSPYPPPAPPMRRPRPGRQWLRIRAHDHVETGVSTGLRRTVAVGIVAAPVQHQGEAWSYFAFSAQAPHARSLAHDRRIGHSRGAHANAGPHRWAPADADCACAVAFAPGGDDGLSGGKPG